MSLQFKKYIRTSNAVKAILVTNENYKEVYEYIKSFLPLCDLMNGKDGYLIRFIREGTIYRIRHNCYIYEDEEGYYQVKHEHYFNQEFEEVK